MADILHLAETQASAETLYEALTTQRGLKSWWSEESEIEPKVGSTAAVGFYGGAVVFKLKIAELDQNSKVAWAVEAGPPEWDKTTITWTISPGEEGKNRLHMAHAGFASTEGGFAGFNYSWGYYITSLIFYLEKGEGMPHKTEG